MATSLRVVTTRNYRYARTPRIRQSDGLNIPTAATISPSRDLHILRLLCPDTQAGFHEIWWGRRPMTDRAEGFGTMAQRRMRVGRMKKVHKPAMMGSATHRLGARLRPR